MRAHLPASHSMRSRVCASQASVKHGLQADDEHALPVPSGRDPVRTVSRFAFSDRSSGQVVFVTGIGRQFHSYQAWCSIRHGTVRFTSRVHQIGNEIMLRALILVVSLGSGALATALMPSADDFGEALASVAEPAAVLSTDDVLVAASDLTPGETLTDASYYWQPWPDNAPGGAVIRRTVRPDAMNELAGLVARDGFAAGEPIRMERLTETQARLLSSALPAGRRAVALRVSAESTAGGFVLPNDRVDVLLTVSGGGSANSISRIIARNVRVLAIDQLLDRAEADSVVGSTATLDLSELQVEAVLAASASGMLSLALRSVADHDLVEPDPLTEIALEPAPAVAVQPVVEQAPRTIIVRRGTEVEIATLQ